MVKSLSLVVRHAPARYYTMVCAIPAPSSPAARQARRRCHRGGPGARRWRTERRCQPWWLLPPVAEGPRACGVPNTIFTV